MAAPPFDTRTTREEMEDWNSRFLDPAPGSVKGQADFLARQAFGPGLEPDQAGASMQIEQRTGMPSSIARSQATEINQQTQLRELADYLRQSQRARAWVGVNPERARLMRDDVANMAWYEKAIRAHNESGFGQLEIADIGYLQFLGLATPQQDQRAAELEELAGIDYDAHGLANLVVETGRMLPITEAAILSGLEHAMAGAVGVGSAAGIFFGPEAAPPAATFGFGAGMLYGSTRRSFQVETGMAYREYLAMRDEQGRPLDPDAIRGAAFMAGLANAGLELAGLGALTWAMRRIPGINQIFRLMSRGAMRRALSIPTYRQALATFAKDWGIGFGGEVSTEVMQRAVTLTAGQWAAAETEGYQAPPVDWAGELGQEAWGAAQGMALLPLLPAGLAFSHDLHTARQAGKAKARYQEMVDRLKNTKLYQRHRESFKGFADAMANAGDDPYVYLDTTGLVTHFQDANVNPTKGFGRLGVSLNDVQDAVAARGDIVVKLSDFMDAAAHDDSLLDFVREHPGGMTALEMGLFQEHFDEILEHELADYAKAQDEFDIVAEEGEQLFREIQSQLQEIPQAPGAAAMQAKLWQRLYETLSRRTGLTPSELWARMPTRFQFRDRPGPVPATTLAQPGMLLEQAAYHGTRHRFERFSTEAIGRGTGAQTYGWGLYFSEAKEVAELYHEQEARAPAVFLDQQNMIETAPQILYGTLSKAALEKTNLTIRQARAVQFAQAVGSLEEAIQRLEGMTNKEAVARREALESLRGRLEIRRHGQVYEVQLPEKTELLDWDKPLAEQPPEVIAAVRRAMTPRPDVVEYWTGRVLDDFRENGPGGYSEERLRRVITEAIESGGYGPEFGSNVWDELREAAPNDAEEFMLWAENTSPMITPLEDTGETLYKMLSSMLGSDEKASMKLLSEGIRGLQYLDAHSRETGEGTHNFVIWDDDAIKITRTFYQAPKIEEIAGYANVMPYLSEEERTNLRADTKARLVDFVKELPSASEAASIAYAGRAKRGWYQRSTKAILDVFGPVDGVRFTSLLAALSPRTSVENNTINALRTWVNWDLAGRPTDRQSILEIMGRSVLGERGEESIMRGWKENSVRALSAENPHEIAFSKRAPKATAFMQNLLGDVQAVTNDAWMAVFAGIDPGVLGTRYGYFGMSALARKAAQILSKRTGDVWTPSEVQETIWSWTKLLYERAAMAGEDRTAQQILAAGDLTHEDLAATPDFAMLFGEGVYRRILEEGGYGERLGQLAGAAPGRPGEAGTVTAAEGTGIAPGSFEADLQRAARRIDRLRAQRLQEKAESAREATRQGWPAIWRIRDAYRKALGIGIAEEAVPGPFRRRAEGTLPSPAVARFEPSPDIVEQLNEEGVSAPTYVEINSPPDFHAAITRAKQTLKYGASVHVYDEAEYAGMRLFLTEDGLGGFALKGDDIVSAFNSSDSGHDKLSQTLLLLAVQEGGRRCDCFDTVLPDLYSEVGFRAVARLPWNDKEAPSDWNKETFARFNNGEPDVVFMVYDPADTELYKPGDGKRFRSYARAVAEQDRQIRKRGKAAQRIQRQEAEERAKRAPRGQVQFDVGRGEALVTIFENSDLTTVLHESGHVFLELFGQLAQQPGAPEQIRQDYETLRRFVGALPGQQLTEEQHEKIATYWEKEYLARGLAPSEELQGVFARMRSWILSVYRLVKDLGRQVNPEVDAVFNRWLATDEEISRVEAARDMRPLFRDPETAGMTGREWTAYQDLQERALQQARDEALRRELDEKRREERRWWKEQEERVRREVAAQVDARPAQKARQWLLGRLADPGVPESQKLSRAWILERYGDENGKAILRQLGRGAGLLWQAEGGISADDAAEILGFGSGEELIRALLTAPRRRDAIAEETRARMSMLRSQALDNASQRAIEAVAGAEGRGEVLAAELALLRRRESMEIAERGARRGIAEEGAADREQYAAEVAAAEERLAALQASRPDDEAAVQEAVAALVSARARAQEASIGRQAQRAGLRQTRAATRLRLPEIRAMAREQIARTRLRDLRPGRFQQAELRASRQTEEAVARRDYETAAAMKQAQLMNHALYREALDAQKRADRIVRRLQRYTTTAERAKLGKAGGDYLDQVDSILEGVDLKRGVTLKELDERKGFLEWKAEQEAAGERVLVPDRLVRAGTPHYREMTLEELQGLDDTIKHIVALAQRKNRLLTMKDQIELEHAVAEMTTTAYETNRILPPDKDIATLLDATKQFGRGFDATLIKVEQLVDWMDGGDPNGSWHRYVFIPIAEAEHRRNDLIKATGAEFEMALEALSDDAKRWMRQKHYIRAVDRHFYGSQIVAAALNVGTESNLDKLKRGFGWSDEDLLAILEPLQANHWEFVQNIWNLLRKLWPLAAETEKLMTGLEPQQLQTRSFRTRFGQEMQGGYYPAVYDPSKSGIIYGYGQQAEAALFEWDFVRPETPHSHLKSRSQKFAKPMLLDLSTVSRHISRVIHDAVYRPVLADVYKIFTHEVLRQTIDRTMGQEYTKQMVPWLHGIANQFSADLALAWWENFLRHARYNTTIMIMGWKATTGVTQLAGIGPSVEVLNDHLDRNGTKWMRLGVQEFTIAPFQTYNWVVEKSGEMRHRFGRMDRDLVDGLRSIEGTDGLLYHMRKSAFYAIGMMDMTVSCSTWVGAYHQALAANIDEPTAIQYADSMVRLSQGAGEAKDLSAFQRGGAKQSEAWKALGLFMGYFSAYYNRQHASVRALRQGEKASGEHHVRDFARFMMKHWWLTILPVILSEKLTGGKPPDDADPEEKRRWWLGRLLGYTISGIPVGREIGSSIFSGYDYRPTPLGEPGKAIQELAKDIPKVLTGEWDPRQLVKHATRVAGYGLGLPLEQPINITLLQSLDMIFGEEPFSLHDLFFRRRKRTGQ